MKKVDCHTLKCWMDAGEAVVVDVREPGEHASERIHGASSLPLSQVAHAGLPEIGGKKLVLHCRSGRRSEEACKKLMQECAGFEVYNLEGGIAAWEASGLPVARSGGRLLPLDRQVQLTVGVLLWIASALTYFVHPMFIILPVVFGTGLVLAGAVGFCGLAKVLARMPWNQKSACQVSCSKG